MCFTELWSFLISDFFSPGKSTTILMQGDKFACGTCHRVYKYKHNLVYHQKHDCGQPQELRCPHCPFSGRQRSQLRKHLFSRHAVQIAHNFKFTS